MAYTAPNPQSYLDKKIGSGHCVAFVQEAASAPHTSQWRQGALVRDSNPPAGTAIATFQDGKYQNRTNGDSHAAILLRVEQDRLIVLDQWVGQKVHERPIHFRNGRDEPRNDGDAYCVVE
jgi:hypothetical protein